MPEGIRPRVNEAREFLEIAKDFKDPKEIIREALSNSWDARATMVKMKFDLQRIRGTQSKKIMVEISDNGEGMSDEPRENVGSSEIEGFFNLGDSGKPHGSIGSKGHGTKIYYKSSGIRVDTWKSNKHIIAESEVPPWETLQKGIVPTYRYFEDNDENGVGTRIRIDGFLAKQKEFKTLDSLIRYIRWYTVLGSFSSYFGDSRKMDVDIKPADSYDPVRVPFGFKFPDEQTDLNEGTDNICKLIGPETVECGKTEDGKVVTVEFVGALLGESLREIVPHTYSHMGLWLCKDFIRIERNNEILEKVFGGQYYYRSMLLFANCQNFDLTANRNNIRKDQEEFDIAVDGIEEICEQIWRDSFVQNYFSTKKQEDSDERERRKKESEAERIKRIEIERDDRINRYKGRPTLKFRGVERAPIKEPVNEAETALLLQAMISSNHPGIDFLIGDYNTTRGVDMVIEATDKRIPSIKWAEIVFSLDNLFKWNHPPEGYHLVVCYELGGVKERQKFENGLEAQLIPKSVDGRYAMLVGGESLDVYVLREILQSV